MPQQHGLGRGLDALLSRKNKTSAPTPIPVSSIPGESEAVFELPIEQLVANDYQPRTHFDEEKLAELADSIKEYGIIQPLVVTKHESGYRLIAGERRLRAARRVGLARVPVVVRDAGEHERLTLALIENIQRADLNPYELALGYKRLADEFNLTQDQIAKRVGKGRSTITNFLRVLNAHPYVQEGIQKGLIGDAHARTLLSLDLEKQRETAEKMIEGKWTLRQLVSYIRSTNHVPKIIRERNEAIVAKEDALRAVLGTRVAISRVQGRGSITIEYYSDEQLTEIVKRLLDALS